MTCVYIVCFRPPCSQRRHMGTQMISKKKKMWKTSEMWNVLSVYGIKASENNFGLIMKVKVTLVKVLFSHSLRHALKWKWLKPRIKIGRNNVSQPLLLPPDAAPPPGHGAAAPLLLPPHAPPPGAGDRAGAHPLLLHQPAHHLQVASQRLLTLNVSTDEI